MPETATEAVLLLKPSNPLSQTRQKEQEQTRDRTQSIQADIFIYILSG